jgi:beta-phosphoglucomutase-like phosphatase (HAD superfamily)
MLRAVIFDFNGIIVNDEPIHFRLFQRVLGEEGMRLGEEDYYARYLGFDDRGAFMAAYKDANRSLDEAKIGELIERKAALYQIAIRNHVDIFPGVQSLIAGLAPTLPLAVASGALRPEIDAILSTARLSDFFRAIVSAEDVTRGKPEPEIFLKALDQLNAHLANEARSAAPPPHSGARTKEEIDQLERFAASPIEPAECLVIEDSKEGVKGARRAGMKCLAVTNSHPAELLSEAHAVVKSLEEVNLDFLERICS